MMPTKTEVCTICNETRTNIKRHIKLTHEKVKSFICDICGKSCSLKYNLEEHIRLRHSKLKLYKCNYCELMFGTPGNRNSHEECKHINDENKRASPGEQMVINVLNKCKIKFEREKSFQHLRSKNGGMLKYDFGIPFSENNVTKYLLIEYDGEHHATPVRYRGIPLEKAEYICSYIIENDKLKNSYAFDNNIPLIRLKFSDNTKLEQIIVRFIREFSLILD